MADITDAPPYARLERLALSAEGTGEVDFSAWLATNLDELADVLGLDLELVGLEVPVGAFRVDLVARVVGSGDLVVVENQFGKLNHDHLGKLMTYAAGQDAAYAVLIAEHFREEFRSTLEWANRSTVEGMGFFALRAEAVRIGASPLAIQLVPEVLPDQWSKAAASVASGGGDTELERAYREFWAPVLDGIKSAHPGWTSSNTPSKASWMSLPAGRSMVSYALSFTTDRRLRVELYVDAETKTEQVGLWEHLLEHREEIERAAPGSLDWEHLPTRRASRIALYYPRVASVSAADAWPEMRAWLLKQLVPMRDALQPAVDTMP